MAAKNWRGKRRLGVIWRMVYGNYGPTWPRVKRELEKKLGLTFDDTFVVEVRDSTGRVRKQVWCIEPDGTTRQVQQRPKKKAPAKKTSSKRAVSQPSKPSRASKAGNTQRRRTTPTPAAQQPTAAPMTERHLRDANGRYAGSRSDEAKYRKAMRNAEAAGREANRHAEELLGWRKPRRR